MVCFEKILFYICLAFIFLRPFLSQLAFERLDFYFTLLFSIAAIPIIAINKNKIKYKSVDFFILLFIFSIIISSVSSINLFTSLNKIYIILNYIIVFYLVRCMDLFRRGKIIKTIVLSAIIICCYGTYQYFWGFRYIIEYLTRNKVIYPFAYEWLERKRVFATFFSPNAFAGFLIMALPLSYSLNYIKKNTVIFSKLLLLIAALLSINLLLTRSLSAIFSLIISFCIILLIKRPKKKYLCLFIAFSIIITVIVFYARTNVDKTFLTPLFSIEKRIEYYKEASSIIKQHPFWGVGIGNFKGEYSLFVHNSYLQIWIELGILGIISYLGIIFLSIKGGVKRIVLGKEKDIYIAIFCALITFILHNAIDFTFFLPEVSWIWWITLALIIS